MAKNMENSRNLSLNPKSANRVFGLGVQGFKV